MSTENERPGASGTYDSWAVPVVGLVLGVVMLAIQVWRDDLGLGLVLLGVMWGYVAIVVLLRRRGEIGELLAGGPSDERRDAIQVQALAVTGQVLIVALVVGFLVQMARGADTQPWVWLGALGGGTYLLSVVAIRSRS
jgi:hypothetical protein